MSESSLTTEFVACFSFCIYNFVMASPFETWGEMSLVTVQCAVQTVQYWVFTEETVSVAPRAFGAIAIIAAATACCLGYCPVALLPVLGLLPTVLGFVARVPQILMNFQQGH